MQIQGILQDSEIGDLDVMSEKADAASISSTSGSENEVENISTASEAFTCLDTALRWFQAQDESDQYQTSVLKKVRDLAACKRAGSLRQTKDKNFKR
ncbi:unnamed protein product [Parnassius apollo]|uniref:(apollo) hypothetical protein n=1 Tax=Parnassius apollo TaxID=110799 RepID=A0A8S3WAV3_PARAO|nr:unnamed protein product [Parnassius apollo]